jgi:hypothetical protein
MYEVKNDIATGALFSKKKIQLISELEASSADSYINQKQKDQQ